MPIRSAAAAPATPGRQPGVLERQAPGGEPELAEPVELPGGPWRHPGRAGRSRRPGRRPAIRNGPGSKRSIRLTGETRGPKPGPERGDARCRSAVTTPIPVIQTRRRSRHVGGFVADARADSPWLPGPWAIASAMALNVPSVRPAIGPREPAIHERREAREPWPEVVVDRRPGSRRRSARSATSRPSPSSRQRRGRTGADVSPARSRYGHATPPAGRGPRIARSGRRATKSTTTEPSAPRPTTADRP